jgi:hypothetical protein
MGNLDPRAPFPAPVKGGQVAFSRWPLLRTARARGTLQERYLRCRVEVAIAGNLKNGVSTSGVNHLCALPRAREAEPSGGPNPARALDRGAADFFLT